MKSKLEAKIKSSGLKVGDWVGNWQPEPIGKIEALELRGSNLNCIVGGKCYMVSEIYYCPSPEEYQQKLEGLRKQQQERGEPFRIPTNEDPEHRRKRLASYQRWRREKKAMGRARSERVT